MLTVLSILLGNQNTIPYGIGNGSSTSGEVISGLIVFVLGAAGSWLIKKTSTDRKTRQLILDQKLKDMDTKIDSRFDEVDRKVTLAGDNIDKMLNVFVTQPRTSLNPNPAPGLVEQLVGKDGLFEVVRHHTAVLDSLVADSKPDNGNSSRDALNRIDEATSHKPSESQ